MGSALPPIPSVCLTGPPCTGKTTLARALAAELGWAFVPEAARLHAAALDRELGFGDVEVIGRLHVELVEEALASGARGLVLDTDLLSTEVYSQFYYARVPAWVRLLARRRRPGLYLLCRADLPFVGEARQRGDAREQPLLAELFEAAVLRAGAPMAWVEGTGPGRLAGALETVRLAGLRPAGADRHAQP